MSRNVADTRGRHALLAVLDGKTQKQVEIETGVLQGTVSLIATQQRLPGRETARKLTNIGLEFGWWSESPTEEQIAADAARKAKEEVAPDSSSKPTANTEDVA